MTPTPRLPSQFDTALAALDLEPTFDAAIDFLLRWQVGVTTHVEDYCDPELGWVKRPSFAFNCGTFAGDFFRNHPVDTVPNVWRMGVGKTWHAAQTVLALCKAHALRPTLHVKRAIAEGGRFLTRMSIFDGQQRGAMWTPPHGFDPQWNEQTGGVPMYVSPWDFSLPGVKLWNSDMCESIAGLLAAAELLGDQTMLDAAERWGQWHEREADFAPGRFYHDIHVDTNQKVERRMYWAMDDGVQALLAAKFRNARWLELYHQKVRILLDHPILLENMPAQQGRHFYWDTSLLHPILENKVPAEVHPQYNRDAVIAKFREYTQWMLGLRLDDGMMAFKYERPGKPDPEGRYGDSGSAGDGAATGMAARMCHLLWKATGETQWCDEALPMLAWMKKAQFPPDSTDRMAGGIPFCHWIIDPKTKRKFDFKRIISTSFAVMTLAEWLTQSSRDTPSGSSPRTA